MKRAGSAIGALAVVTLLGFWYLDGHCPAAIGEAPFATTYRFAEALDSVDSRGLVDLKKLQAQRRSLDEFVASLASTATDRFATSDEAVVFWLNAYHSLTLQTLLDGDDSVWRTWPVGGRRLTRWALVRHHLRDLGDPRIALALCDGTKSGPRLDAVPYDPVLLESQLTDAARRFIRRADVVNLRGTVVEVSPRLLEHEAELLAALPEGNRHLLQFIWAFLPDTCDGSRPGCETRGALDSACGRMLTGCTIQPMPRDDSPPVTQ